jgi:oxaloacetate decarboxylase alpha subunit
VRIGIDGLDTAFAPLANGASVPALGTLLKSLRLLAQGTPVSEQRLYAIGEADRLLAEIADAEGFEAGARLGLRPGALLPTSCPAKSLHCVMHGSPSWPGATSLHVVRHDAARVRSDVGAPPIMAPLARPIEPAHSAVVRELQGRHLRVIRTGAFACAAAGLWRDPRRRWIAGGSPRVGCAAETGAEQR